MAPQYGEVRVDYITYTTGVVPNEGNATAYVSGLINNPTFSGNVIIEGDATIDGNLNVSGAINASGVVISGITGLFDAGTEALPSIAFALDPNTGIYNPSANEVGISTGGNERLRVDTTGNVGIGTTNPQAKLDIRSSADAPSLTFNGSGQSIVGDATNQLAIGRDSASPFSLYLQGRASNNAARNITLNPVGGNVGIRTNDPLRVLDVNSDASRVAIFRSTAASANIELKDPTTTNALAVGKNGEDLALYSDDIKRLTVLSGGNVGIGTTNPQALLDVNGAIVARSAHTGSYLTTGLYAQYLGGSVANISAFRSGSSSCDLSFSTTDGAATAPDEHMRIRYDGNVGIGTTNPQNKLTVQQSAVTNAPSRSSALYVENNANCEIQMVGNSANNTQLRMGTSGNSFDGALDYSLADHRLDFYTNSARQVTIDSNGDVGIGTSDPQAKLEVSSPGNSATDVELSRTRLTGGSNNPMFRVLANETNNLITLATNGSNSDSEIQIKTTSTEAVRIDKDGNVGIGTTDPYNELVVRGSGNATTTSVSPSEFTTTIQTNSAYINCGKVNELPAIQGSGSGTAYKLLLNPFAGNVGIGTDSPTSKLVVQDDQGFQIDLNRIGGAPSRCRLKNSGNLFDISQNVNGITFSTGTTPTEKVRIDSSGSVGIGTTNSNYPLTVQNVEAAINIRTLRSGSTFNNSALIFDSPRSTTGDNSSTPGRGLLTSLGNSSSTTGILWLAAASASLNTTDTDADLKNKQCGIRLASDGTMQHWASNVNTFAISGPGVVSIASGFITLNGNKLGAIKVSIANDAFATITPPRAGAGYYTVIEGGDEQFPNANARVLGYADWNSSPVNVAINLGSLMEVSVSGPPTGTTGTDGKVTVFAGGDAGKIYIENRLDQVGQFFVNFI